MPVTLAWEVNNIGGQDVATALFHLPPKGVEQMVFLGTLQLTQEATLAHWERLTANAIQPQDGITYTPRLVGGEVIGSPALQAHLPSRLIAYTSGADTLWEELEQQEYHDISQMIGVGYDAGDRPPGWSLERDWETEQPVRVGNAITQLDIKMRTALQGLAPGSDLLAVLKKHNETLVETIRPLGDLSGKVFENQVRRSQNPTPPVMRVSQADLRTAAVALALHHSAKAGPSLANQATAKAERDRRIAASRKDEGDDSVEWVFNTVDWFQASHLSFTYRDADDRVSKK